MKQLLLITLSVFISTILFSQEEILADASHRQGISWSDPLSIEAPKSEKLQNLESDLAKRTCFCVVSHHNLTNQKKRSGTLLDLTSRVNTTYRSMSQKNRRRCNAKCTEASRKLSASDLNKIANLACSQGVSNGSLIRAFSALSTKRYMTADNVGVLVNNPAVTEQRCTCPRGWTVDNGQSDPRKKCKKQICKTASPVANMELPDLGFIWDNTIYQWIKGQCTTHTIKPAVCRIKK